MSWFSVIPGAVDVVAKLISASGDRKELRRVIRQRILAPNVDRLHIEGTPYELARDIVTAARGFNGTSILAAIIYFLAGPTVLNAKIKLIADMIQNQAVSLQTNVEVEENESSFRVTRGLTHLKRLTRDILAIL